MKKMPDVSVVIPFFNRIDHTVNAVKSVLDQTYPTYEIILVDDFSSDDIGKLMELINTNNKIRYFKNSTNLGPSASRNKGIDNTIGKYIAFLDSDDLFVPEKLMTQITYMEEKNVVFTHTSYWRRENDQDTQTVIKSGFFSYIYPLAAFHCRIATPTVVIRRDFLGDNRFPEEFRFGEDGLLWLNLSKDVTLKGINIPLSIVNVCSTTHTNNKLIQRIARVQMANELAKHSIFLSLLMKFYNLLRDLLSIFKIG